MKENMLANPEGNPFEGALHKAYDEANSLGYENRSW